jgi:hypothetical protein
MIDFRIHRPSLNGRRVSRCGSCFRIALLLGVSLCRCDSNGVYERTSYKMARFKTNLSIIGHNIVEEANRTGAYPEQIPDDLGHFRLDEELMDYFLGKTTGASVPGDMAPSNVSSASSFAIYAVPACDPALLFKVTPHGVYTRKEDGNGWHLDRSLAITPLPVGVSQ